jgi:hypothetical protein
MLPARTILAVSLWPLVFGLLAFLIVTGLLAQEGPRPGAGSARTVLPRGPAAGPRRSVDEKLSERMREGTRLTDVVGSFQTAGDRISFHPDGKGESYRVLENLALQRVDEYLGANRGTPTWLVSGVMTEFRGGNFLLVSKAVVRSVGESAAP